MPRRRELKGVASGIAFSFISRNNDVDGYWGLGLFYSCAVESGKNKFALNLITGESNPNFKYSKRVTKSYFEFLLTQLSKKGFEIEQIKEAVVELEFNVHPTKNQIIFKHTWGDPFLCIVKLTDDLNKSWSFKVRSWCGQHNPKKEHRSIRRYSS